jgi:hypothetical protein
MIPSRMRRIAGALVLLPLLAGRLAASEDHVIPEWVISGIAAVETNSVYRDGELVRYRDRRDGSAGEVGPWQLAPDVLADLKAQHLRDRIRREPVLAESLARAWLLRCYRQTGDWFQAVAVYHTGPQGSTRRGRDYAERVLAAGRQQE